MGVGSAFDLFQRLLGLTSGGLAGFFLLGIFCKRANARVAWAGVVASALLLAAVQVYTRVHVYLYSLVGITACVGVGYLVSLLAPGRGSSGDAEATAKVGGG